MKKVIALKIEAGAHKALKHAAVEQDCSIGDLVVAAAKAGNPTLFASLQTSGKDQDQSNEGFDLPG